MAKFCAKSRNKRSVSAKVKRASLGEERRQKPETTDIALEEEGRGGWVAVEVGMFKVAM